MKKILALICSFALVLCLVACSNGVKSVEELRETYPLVAVGFETSADVTPSTVVERIDDEPLLRFKVTAALGITEESIDMFEGLDIPEEDLLFYEQSGMRYLETQWERFEVEIISDFSDAYSENSIVIEHNLMFGEMSSIMSANQEFVGFVSEIDGSYSCGPADLFYVTDSGQVLAVCDYSNNTDYDGFTLEHFCQILEGTEGVVAE